MDFRRILFSEIVYVTQYIKRSRKSRPVEPWKKRFCDAWSKKIKKIFFLTHLILYSFIYHVLKFESTISTGKV